jgi:phage/plasmid-like protein (TIGR03299 family)
MNPIKQKPWDGLSVEASTNLSPRELAYKLNLDFEVSRVPSGRPKSYANQETFQFLKSFTEHGEIPFKTIGTLDNGRIIWALAPLKNEFTLVQVDQVKGYLLLASRNITRDNIEVYFMAIRSACNSSIQVNSKARTVFKNICRRPFTNQFPFVSLESHKFDKDMIKKTKEAISFGQEAISAFAQSAELLINKTVNNETAERYMINVFQPEKSIKSAEKNDSKTALAIEAFKTSPGHELKSANMTAWGLLNAVIYTIDHCLGKNKESRLRLAWFGPNAKIKQRALELALKM